MATTKLIDLADIAQLIETDLNTLSTTLYVAGDISKELVFNIVDNFDDYRSINTTPGETYQDATDIVYGGYYEIITVGTTDYKTLGSLSNAIGTKFTATTTGSGTGVVLEHVRFTPCLLKKLNSSIVPDPNIGAYNEVYTLELYGYQKEYAMVKEILDTYVMNQRGAYRTYSGWLIQETVDGFDFTGNITPDDGTRDDRFYGFSTLFWGFLDGGVHSSIVDVTLDGVSVPVSSFNLESQKEFIAGVFNDTDNSVGIAQSAGIGFSISFPLLHSNTALVELAKDLMLESTIDLNNTYTLRYNDGLLDQSYTVIRTSGKLNYEAGGIVTMEAGFAVFKTGVL